jgi:hypothetical protein
MANYDAANKPLPTGDELKAVADRVITLERQIALLTNEHAQQGWRLRHRYQHSRRMDG